MVVSARTQQYSNINDYIYYDLYLIQYNCTCIGYNVLLVLWCPHSICYKLYVQMPLFIMTQLTEFCLSYNDLFSNYVINPVSIMNVMWVAVNLSPLKQSYLQSTVMKWPVIYQSICHYQYDSQCYHFYVFSILRLCTLYLCLRNLDHLVIKLTK